MTEVKHSAFGKLGLFATKAYATGDDVLTESPAIVLVPSTEEKNGMKKRESHIKIPKSIDEDLHGTFRSMVTAGISWIENSHKQEGEILELYFPTADSPSKIEERIRAVATDAIKYLKKNSADSADWETVEKVMLIWACNSFQGGRIYLKISRINHSCDPNAIIQAKGEDQKLLAATDIAAGDEITISYLGSMLYSESAVRREKLKNTKYFICRCERCNGEDNASSIPCPSNHPRQTQQSLDEDAQYDDDQAVKYICASSDSPLLGKHEKLQKSMAAVTSRVVGFLEEQEVAKGKKSAKGDASDEEVLEEHLSLARTVMGDRHWTTNLLLLLLLDRRLSQMSSTMLTTQQIPEMEDVAEAIDGLQRLYRFVDSLDLKLHPGHILGDVIIGTARTLVSLGDLKSQKYGAEWLEKITDYVNKFESDGRQKVVSALSVAWKKHDRDISDEGKKNAKKSKSAK